jgi:hypothetical protein
MMTMLYLVGILIAFSCGAIVGCIVTVRLLRA